MTRIKFCGLTRESDVLLADELGVDFIGFIFAPSSKRFVTIEQAKKLRMLIKHAKSVGVFAGQSIDEIASISREVGFDTCQIYDAPESIHAHLPGLSIIHAYRSVPEESMLRSIENPQRILLDGKSNGESADRKKIEKLPIDIRHHLFLAGGLTPRNVADVIQDIQPYAVDTASGIESSPGIKDPEAMRRFIDTVRSLPT